MDGACASPALSRRRVSATSMSGTSIPSGSQRANVPSASRSTANASSTPLGDPITARIEGRATDPRIPLDTSSRGLTGTLAGVHHRFSCEPSRKTIGEI